MGNCCPRRGIFAFEEREANKVRGNVTESSTVKAVASSNSIPVFSEEAEQLFNLGRMFEKGKSGVEMDMGKAFINFLRAAELGHPKSQLRVAYCYDVGQGIEKDAEKAVEWYTKAAVVEPKAQFSLALCYAKGLGVDRSDEKAVFWFRKSADSGYERALYNLGYCHEMGTGVSKNVDQALEFYKEAAKRGSTMARKRLELFGIHTEPVDPKLGY